MQENLEMIRPAAKSSVWRQRSPSGLDWILHFFLFNQNKFTLNNLPHLRLEQLCLNFGAVSVEFLL